MIWAIADEKANIVKHRVWDLQNPREAAEVRKEDASAVFRVAEEQCNSGCSF